MCASTYLPHVHLDHIREVSARFVVTEEGALERFLIQQVHRVGLEGVILVWHANEHGHAPSLQAQITENLVIHGYMQSTIKECYSKLLKNYIVDTFKCGNHGTDASCTLDASVDSSAGHFSKHLQIVKLKN